MPSTTPCVQHERLARQPVHEVELPSPMCAAELEQPGRVQLSAQECQPTEALELDRDYQVPGGWVLGGWVGGWVGAG
jgi:hypothetical protein